MHQQQRKLIEKINQEASQKDNHNASEESPEKRNLRIPKEIPEKDGNKLKEDQQQDQGSDAEDDVVPVVIRPGHIRFEPLGKGLILCMYVFLSGGVKGSIIFNI